MGALEVAVLLLAWTALFGLLVVVPWGAVRVVGGVLETDVEALVDPQTASVRGADPVEGSDRRDATRTAMMDGGEGDAGLRSERNARDG